MPSWLRDAALAGRPASNNTRSTKSKSSKRGLSPSKFVKKALHAVHNPRKRSADSPDRGSAAKRVRAGAADSAIVIDSDEETEQNGTESGSHAKATPVALSDQQWIKIAEVFRVKAKDLEFVLCLASHYRVLSSSTMIPSLQEKGQVPDTLLPADRAVDYGRTPRSQGRHQQEDYIASYRFASLRHRGSSHHIISRNALYDYKLHLLSYHS